MTLEEKRAYAKGYAAGSRGSWPDHRPPLPPDEQCKEMIVAATHLRNGVDGIIATFSEDDEISVRLGTLVDSFDLAMAKVGLWLRERNDD